MVFALTSRSTLTLDPGGAPAPGSNVSKSLNSYFKPYQFSDVSGSSLLNILLTVSPGTFIEQSPSLPISITLSLPSIKSPPIPISLSRTYRESMVVMMNVPPSLKLSEIVLKQFRACDERKD